MNLIHGTSLLSTPLPLWTYISTLGKKIDDEKTLLLKIIWLEKGQKHNLWKTYIRNSVHSIQIIL